MKRIVLAVLAALLAATVARSGHELPVYPSYYPHEIEIVTVAPGEALDLVRAGKLHAAVGVPAGEAPAPSKTVAAVESLGSLVVVRIDPQSPLAADEAGRCAAVAAVVRDLAGRAEAAGVTVHPYPVTPWHGDYLHHADRAEAARQLLAGAPPPPATLRLRAEGALATRLAPPEWLAAAPPFDATIETMDVAGVVAEARQALNGLLGPRYVRFGWFHAYRVLGGALRDPDARQAIEAMAEWLKGAAEEGAPARINLERQFVRALTARCDAAVAGYTVKRELYNVDFSAGIENIAFDALEGFTSPMFLRTVKLKDYPWNGSLRLGVAARPDAAWSPVGGFTGPFGRLAWYALSDPALIPSPYEASWVLNRISEVEGRP